MPEAGAAPTAGRRSASVAGRLLALPLGLGCGLLAAWLAWHHPLAPLPLLLGAALLAAGQAAWPPLWLVALPALLPWLGLGAWSGWLVAEEMDIAVLAVACGAYLRWAWRPGHRLRAGRASRAMHALGLLLLALWTLSVLVAMQRGVAAAGGWALALQRLPDGSALGWWHGVREPLNALRLAKPTLAALLLLPLWWRLQQRPGQRCADQLSLGLALALAGTTLWCVYERLAFPGLLNMSADYRSTGPFWETQFGGASLDICLALTLPFALRLAWVARSTAAALGAWLVVLGGVYAGLTTFSRIVYLALPVGALLWWWLQQRQQRAAAGGQAAVAAGGRSATGAAALLCLAVGGLGLWLFPSAGYRGLLALLGCAVALLLLVPRSSGQPLQFWLGAWLLGPLAAVVLLLAAQWLPKGTYLAYALAALATGALLWRAPSAGLLPALGGAGFITLLACMVAVAVGWGGPAAWPAAAGAAGVLTLVWLLSSLQGPAPWPLRPRWLAGTASAMVLVLAGGAVFGGGAFMAGRLGQTAADRAERLQHWRDGLALNSGGTAGWLGEGLGRYPDLYALQNRPESRPGDIRLVLADGQPVLRLVAGNHPLGHGALLRLSQRTAVPPGTPLTLQLELRATGAVELQAEICSKHLLYDEQCRVTTATSQASAGQRPAGEARDAADPATAPWQTVQLALPAAEADGAVLPRMQVFSLASRTPRQPLDLRRASLTDPSGRPWLHNADFAAGTARWFATSDRKHLPWHAKNLGVHLLVEQGWLGLLALAALSAAALVALLGPLRRHPLAPALAGALVGCWVVGSVDSVLDMPRVATWLLLLTGMALHLHLPRRAGHRLPAAQAGPQPALPPAADGQAG